MATAEARRRQEGGDARPCVIVDKRGNPTWSIILQNNPRFAPRGTPISDAVQVLNSRPNGRPYIDYARSTKEQWAWRNCPPERGEIYFSESEKERIDAIGKPYWIVVEPTLKPSASPNKNWGIERWRELTETLDLCWRQLGEHGTLHRPIFMPTSTIRDAMIFLAGARLYVGHEGALHHAAAALGIPAVVIFGGYVGPKQTGYDTHFNLTAGGEPCGMRVPCDHCRAAMGSITVEAVASAIRAALPQ